MSRPAGSASYRSDVDGLRGLAVLAVAIFHADFDLGGRVLAGGYVGVDMFFVISGFVITQKLIAESHGGRPWLRSFLAARSRRILPALLVMSLVSFVPAFLLMWPSQFESFSQSTLAALLFVSNIFFFFQDPYEAAGNLQVPMIHTWSLGVEFQFYALFPLLFLLLPPSRRAGSAKVTILAATLASLAAAETLSHFNRSASFYLPFTRFWEFGVGALVAFVPFHKVPGFQRLAWAAWLLPFVGLVLLGWSMVGFSAETLHPGLITSIPVLATAAIIWFHDPLRPVTRLLSLKLLVGLGLVSYSVYLWHQPVLAFLRLASPAGVDPAAKAAALLAALGLGILSWRFVEEPFRRRARIAPAFRNRLGLAAGALLAGFCIVGATTGYSLSKLYPSDLLYEPKRGIATVNGKPCLMNTVEKACLIGDPSAKPSIALLGDSHMATLTASIGEVLARNKQSALVMVMVGCPFIEGVLRYTYPRDCQTHAEQVFAALKERGIRKVIINDFRNAYLTGNTGAGSSGRAVQVYSVAAGKESPTRQEDVLALQHATIQRLLDANVSVVFIAQVPDGAERVPDAVRARIQSHALPYSFDPASYLDRSRLLFSDLASFGSNPLLRVVRPHEIFCAGGSCRTHSETRLFYTDSNHLSEDGAAMLIGAISPIIAN